MLTGMANRRAFLETAEAAFHAAREQGTPLTLLMLDVDHFKSINDRFGHLEGDRALVAFSSAVMEGLRPGDAVGRLGGEEFGVLLQGTTLPQGHEVAMRLLNCVRTLELAGMDAVGSHRYRITASMGLGTLRGSDRSLRDLLDRADQALYQAKREGRDRIALADADLDGQGY